MWSRQVKKNLAFVFALSLGLISKPGFSTVGYDELATDELESVLVCPVEGAGCVKQSCMDLCVERTEDPLECPLFCDDTV